jgi:hypothetical protein
VPKPRVLSKKELDEKKNEKKKKMKMVVEMF